MPDCLDVFFALAAYFSLVKPGCSLRAASVDFCHAYKNVGIAPGQEEFSSVLLRPPSGPLLVAQLRAQPFGSSRAPANWGRVTALLKWIFLRLFGIVLAVFVDDCYLVEPSLAVECAYFCVCEVIRICGFDLDPAKACVPSQSILLLGALISFSEDCISAAPPDSRRDALIAELGEFFEIVTNDAAEIRGGN